MIELLKEKGITVYSLAKQLNRSPQSMEYIVKRKKFKPDLELLQNIADIIGCDVKDVLDKEN
jgi:transcriptional regulator with XRE-family HTH domain